MLTHNVAFTGGGTFFRAWRLAQHLTPYGHDVTLVASAALAHWRFRERQETGLKLVEAPGLMPRQWRYGYDPYEVTRRLAWTLGRRADIVHAFDCRPVVIYPALALQRAGARLVMDWCDWFGKGGAVEERPQLFVRIVLRYLETYYEETFRHRADATTVINSALHSRAEALGVQPKSILRLPNGADPQAIRLLDRDQARLTLGLPRQVPLVGYLGSMFPADRDLMAATFELVRQRCPTIGLVLIGNPKNDLPQTSGVIRTGFVDSEALNHYLAACDVLLLPLTDTVANRGRFPSKLADYFAAGRPIVASAVGDVTDLLEQTRAGLATQPAAEALALGIEELLADAPRRARLGQNGRRAAESEFNWRTLAGRVDTLYRQLFS
jgi:glycosyltransferase involved in cell wall biosynthesis